MQKQGTVRGTTPGVLFHHDSELESEVKGRQECAKADHGDWQNDESRAEGLNLAETGLEPK